ncbi:hypothetical protein [Paraburkholderia phosphatilytica]|uniref:hypothetical protein n=1 Tax=Paraburkholderia phosphatilytica TaxID=2282883 RepID=UPI000E4B1205|nr:hypothetical protein [Paraburkholderia phosphatilytica]
MKPRIIFQLIAVLLLPLTISEAHAQTWAAHHPWRASDNSRLARQNYRISKGVQDGQLTHAQAHQLRADDHSIRTEERADASVNGSHLTPQEQRQISTQENANSSAIYGERH